MKTTFDSMDIADCLRKLIMRVERLHRLEGIGAPTTIVQQERTLIWQAMEEGKELLRPLGYGFDEDEDDDDV